MHKVNRKQLASTGSFVCECLTDLTGLRNLQCGWNDIFGESQVLTQISNAFIGQIEVVMAPGELGLGITTRNQALKSRNHMLHPDGVGVQEKLYKQTI